LELDRYSGAVLKGFLRIMLTRLWHIMWDIYGIRTVTGDGNRIIEDDEQRNGKFDLTHVDWKLLDGNFY